MYIPQTHTIKVLYRNGDSIITRINATPGEIARLYIGAPRIYENFETGEETRTYCYAVEYLDE